MKHPYDQLKQQIAQDPEYAWAWHCNLAMPFIDAGCDDAVAQRGAAAAMQILFGVDTSQNANYPFARGIYGAHPPIPVRGEPMACPCGKCPDGYFGAEG